MHEPNGQVSELVGILRDLVRVNTSQPDGNESVLVRYLEGVFEPFAGRIEKTVLVHSEVRSSLVLRIGPDVPGGLAFVGHLDTVTAGDESKWTHPPYAAVISDGYVHGRGSLDMKAGVAAMTVAALNMLRSDTPLAKPLYVCYTADEERGGTGARALRELGVLGQVDGIVIPEPTDNKIGIAEKGAFWLRLTLQGKLAHGAEPNKGINAVEAAMQAAGRVKDIVAGVARHPLLGQPTAAVTRFQGGIMTNIIPDQAVVELDIRTVPAQSHDALLRLAESCLAETLAAFPGATGQVEPLNNHPSIETNRDHPFVRLVQAEANAAGLEAKVCGLPYFTDAGHIIPATGSPFVILGPGSEGMAHQLNEAVRIEDAEIAAVLYRQLAVSLCC